MSIYCTRGQHHRCESCDCTCHPKPKKSSKSDPETEVVLEAGEKVLPVSK